MTEQEAMDAAYRASPITPKSMWHHWQIAWQAALQWAAEGQKPFGFITEESVWRLENGGNNKGAVPIHKHPSNTARMPLYAAPVPNADLLEEVKRLRKALSFYADETRYWGPNTPLREQKESSARPAGCAPTVERETADEAIEAVESFGPWGADLNEHYRRQIVLADEVKRLRRLYEMAVKGRQEMRNALREARAHNDQAHRGGAA